MKTGMPLREAVALLGVSRRSLYRWAGRGWLNIRVVNHCAMVKVEELGQLIAVCKSIGEESATMELMENNSIRDILQRLMEGSEKLLTVNEVARLLGVSKSLIHYRINAGELKAVKIGCNGKRPCVRVLWSSVEVLLREH